MDLPNTRLWRDDPRPMASSPLIVVPTASSDAVMLEAVKVWPGKAGVRRKVGATANLDSSARVGFAILRVGAKKRDSTSNKETDRESKKERSLL